MAEIYRSVGGRKITKFMATIPEVQAEVESRCFEMAVRAEELLQEHRADGHAEIDVQHGRVDWYVILSDDRGDKAALSIVYGRQARVDPETGEHYGEMEGLFILHRATNLPKRRKGKVKI